MSKRKEFSRKVKREAIERAGGRCQKCTAVLKPGEAEVDHILPLEMGGESVIANAQVLCKVCHKAKTAKDVRSIRKSDRARDKASGAIKPAGEIRARNDLSTGKVRRERASLPPRRLYQ